MATPIIVFNTSTGSDTTASGSSGAVVANGTSASFSGSVVTLDGSPDLSGFVAADDILWLATSSGRQWFDLSSADDGADTVTCVDAPAGTASGLTWGIGGKRNDFDVASNRVLLETDIKDQWIMETESSQTISSVVSPTSTTTASDGNAVPVVRGSSGGRKTITQTANAAHFDFANTATAGWKFNRLQLENTNGTKTSANAINFNMNKNTFMLYIHDCELGDATNVLNRGFSANDATDRIGLLQIVDSYVHDCNDTGVYLNSSAVSSAVIVNSMFVDNGGHGFYSNTPEPANLFGSVFANNSSTGARIKMGSLTMSEQYLIVACTFAGNGDDGFQIVWASTAGVNGILNNVFASNSGYGVGGVGSALPGRYLMRNNDLYNNTSGAIEETDLVDTDGSTANPTFTDSANNDFSIGTNLKALGIPNDIGKAGLTTSFSDIGAAQCEEPAGGGGGGCKMAGSSGGIAG